MEKTGSHHNSEEMPEPPKKDYSAPVLKRYTAPALRKHKSYKDITMLFAALPVAPS